MSQTTNEMRACPFCGGAATAENYAVEAWVGCRTCHIGATRRHGQFDDTGLPEAIAAWNARHEQAQGGMAVDDAEWAAARLDLRMYGCSFMRDGKRIPPHEVYITRPTADARQETQANG